ncbi:hypothetical protein ZWY2020_015001 [Hordeum vulgare]|nr:hypothetical protein ZWY2020_015001 [Hordeum vulgare]
MAASTVASSSLPPMSSSKVGAAEIRSPEYPRIRCSTSYPGKFEEVRPWVPAPVTACGLVDLGIGDIWAGTLRLEKGTALGIVVPEEAAAPAAMQARGSASSRRVWRQGSLYSLTLDEVQSQLTEPLLSMNLDELLKSVFPEGMDPVGGVAGQSEPTLGLHRQGSITMPPELSKKTVDEVWKGIQDSPKRSGEEGSRRRRERQPTFGEMTLEDFLVKAGVVAEGHLKDSMDLPANMGAIGSSVIAAAAPSLNPGAHWLQQYQQQTLEPQHPSMAGPFMAGHLGPRPLAVATGAIMESIYPDGQITSPMLDAHSDPQTPGRKRGASDGIPDKVVERRQKRMIKNRESAARLTLMSSKTRCLPRRGEREVEEAEGVGDDDNLCASPRTQVSTPENKFCTRLRSIVNFVDYTARMFSVVMIETVGSLRCCSLSQPGGSEFVDE